MIEAALLANIDREWVELGEQILPWAGGDRPAREVLAALEAGEREGATARPAALIDDLPLFRAVPPSPPPAPAAPSAIEARLREVNPDMLTPREALELVYELKALGEGPVP